ncbi:hypothetical protein SJAV_05350 [Sulfurisphaera javensis]|uniref:Uncharacterized protein n=1 Tax=Sulfurisphaera javensis TaxID=2049879 RepID=A0AAT9GPM6_9CREN
MMLRKFLPIILLGIFILEGFFIVNAQTNSNVIVTTAPLMYQHSYLSLEEMTLTTTQSQAILNLYLFNPTFVSESVPIYVNGSERTVVTISPYSYVDEQLQLGLGIYNVSVNGNYLLVNVIKAPYGEIPVYINGTQNVFVANVKPGGIYYFNVTFQMPPNTTPGFSMVTGDLGFFHVNPTYYPLVSATYENGYIEVQVPQGIPQGVYFAYVYLEYTNYTNVNQVLGYSLGVIILNVSYGISQLSSPVSLTENGVTISMQNISGFTYLYIKYPFSYENSYTITVGSKTYTIGNMTATNYAYGGGSPGYYALFYGSSVPFAISPNGIIVKLPQFGIASITISTPTGTISVSIPPKVTLGKLNVEVVNQQGVAIPNAVVSIYNVTTNSLISKLTTNSSGMVTLTLPIGEEVKIYASALGYLSNSTTVTVSSSTLVKIYLTPIQITISNIEVNGSAITPIVNTTVNTKLVITFTVNTNSNITPNVTVKVNGMPVSVTEISKNEYEISYTFSSPGIYTLTITAEYNSVSTNRTITINVKPVVTTTTSTTVPTTTTSTLTTTTSSSTTTTSPTTTSTTTSTSVPVPSTTTSSLPLTDIIIVVVVIIIAAIAAVIVLRR